MEPIRSLGWRAIGSLLVEEGLLTPEQLVEAFTEQQESGRRLGELAVERGWVHSLDVALAVARQHGLEFVDLASTEIDPQVATLLSEEAARRYRAVPLRELGENHLLVGIADPSDLGARDEFRMALGRNITVAVVEQPDLEIVLHRLHRPDISIVDEEPDLVEESDERQEIWNAATSVPAVKLVNSALSRGIEEGASDVHFDPEEAGIIVRIRVDGVVRELMRIPKSQQAGVISRLKIMASLDIAERRAPQDGRVFVRPCASSSALRASSRSRTSGWVPRRRLRSRAPSSSPTAP